MATPSWKSEVSAHAQTATSQCYLLFTDQVSHWKNQPLPFFQLLGMAWGSNLQRGYPLIMRLVGDVINFSTGLSKNEFWSVNHSLVTWPKQWRQLSPLFIKGYHWSTFNCIAMEVETNFEVSTNHVFKKSSRYEGLMTSVSKLDIKRALGTKG